ncbi:MAG: cytochrome c [Alphaproteobacteria bacterium]|jgi:cytochrome c553|nr:cytochrome c [Alphaproteobacteria bacterium]MBT4084225.1 cytochrome c [Alphaproteobacteria bacterium]MBT4543564.1 cytochrome c [Alphaproteobacteria bacterium]MBT5919137.1 cytochrome c [Alphaproteobacteria bacterium]MBT7745710.1 cytochrome c [Alphaproteobacteria bacterium]
MKALLTMTFGAAILVATTGQALADAAAGKAVFDAKGCADCHYTEGPAREKIIDDQLAKKGPELWYAGSKFQKDWLSGWLVDPKPIRPMKFNDLMVENPGDHPKLGGGDAGPVRDFLMSLTSKDVKAGKVKPKKNPKGRQIFAKKMPCSGCHEYVGRKKKIMGGRSGPSLVEAGIRLNPDWILAYLQKPKVFKPVKMMPVFVGLLSDKDMLNVSRYVANFKPKKKK